MKNLFFLILIILLNFTNLNAQWEPRNKGCESRKVGSIVSDSKNLYLGSDIGIFLSTDNGLSWLAMNNGMESVIIGSYTISSLAANGQNIYAGTHSFGIFLSTDKGIKWVSKSNGMPYSVYHYTDSLFDTIYHFEISAILVKEKNIFAAYYGFGGDTIVQGFYSSTNNGFDWIQKTKGLPIYKPADNYLIQDIFSLTMNGNNLFAGTRFGVYMTSDNGDKWIPKNSGMVNGRVFKLTTYGDNVYAIPIGGGIYQSSDLGDSWQYVSGKGFLCCDLIVRDNIMIAIGKGVNISKNHGVDWLAFNSGLPIDFEVHAITLIGEYLYAGTNDGIYRAKLSDLGITDVKETEQTINNVIYPNPATDFLELSFAAEPAQFKIEIFSIEGIKMFEAEPATRIDVSRLVAGVYFVKYGSRVSKFVKM